MFNMQDSLSWSIIKIILTCIIVFLASVGLAFIFSGEHFPEEIDYYENGIKLDAIEYHNEIYLKKGE